MTPSTFNPFLIGCIGALAPEIIRLYKLRLSPTLRWSWGYLFFSIPFVLLGGFMAYILEPTTGYAAFYTGVSTPFIVTTLTRDSEREAQAIQQSAVAKAESVSRQSGLRGVNLPPADGVSPREQRLDPHSYSHSSVRRVRSRQSRPQLIRSFLKAL